jgi:uncharacterized protein (TIGR02453 family)
MNVVKLVSFLKALKNNNNKEWLELNRAEYEVLRSEFSKLIEDIKFLSLKFDKAFENYNTKKVAYRINRDIRFSKDKSPYKAEFGALFAENKKEEENGYHFHIDYNGNLFIGGGAYLPSKENLTRIKKKIISNPETFEAIVYNPKFVREFEGLSKEFIYKRVPTEFANVFEFSEELKLKGFFAVKSFGIDDYKHQDLAKFISHKFEILSTLVKYLREIVD